MPQRKTHAFVVAVEVDGDATEAAARSYVEEAVSVWRGQLRPPGAHGDHDPGDPLFSLELVAVKRHVRRRALKKPGAAPSA